MEANYSRNFNFNVFLYFSNCRYKTMNILKKVRNLKHSKDKQINEKTTK